MTYGTVHQEDDFELVLLRNTTLCDKIRESKIYAQNVYAALCNTTLINNESGQDWGCSWRYAGAIIAKIRGDGETYMDYYCSGTLYENENGYVPESVITYEVEEDFRNIGWSVKCD